MPTPRFFGDNFCASCLFLMVLGAFENPVVCASNASKIIKKYWRFEKLQPIYYHRGHFQHAFQKNKHFQKNKKYWFFKKTIFRKNNEFFEKVSFFLKNLHFLFFDLWNIFSEMHVGNAPYGSKSAVTFRIFNIFWWF